MLGIICRAYLRCGFRSDKNSVIQAFDRFQSLILLFSAKAGEGSGSIGVRRLLTLSSLFEAQVEQYLCQDFKLCCPVSGNMLLEVIH